MSKVTPSVVRRGWVKESELAEMGYQVSDPQFRVLRKDERWNSWKENGQWHHEPNDHLQAVVENRKKRTLPVPGVQRYQSNESLPADFKDGKGQPIVVGRMPLKYREMGCPALGDRTVRYAQLYTPGAPGPNADWVNVYHRDDKNSLTPPARSAGSE